LKTLLSEALGIEELEFVVVGFWTVFLLLAAAAAEFGFNFLACRSTRMKALLMRISQISQEVCFNVALTQLAVSPLMLFF
jgi:hypothetical protein